MILYEKVLEGNHNGIIDITIMSVFLNLFGEDVNGFDDTSYVLHIDIFGLMAFTNYVLPEVDLFENL